MPEVGRLVRLPATGKGRALQGGCGSLVPEGPLASSAELQCASGRATGSKRPASTSQEHRLGRVPQQPRAGCWSSSCCLAAALGKTPASSRSSATTTWLCCSWHLAHAATTSNQHCWYESFCSGSCISQLHVRPAFRFTVSHYCVSGTWRRTAACVLCTLTSDRTLAGNGSTSLRATLLTFVQALVRTFAAQTPLTARYVQYMILPGLVAVTAPFSLGLINIQSLQSSISSSDQYS